MRGLAMDWKEYEWRGADYLATLMLATMVYGAVLRVSADSALGMVLVSIVFFWPWRSAQRVFYPRHEDEDLVDVLQRVGAQRWYTEVAKVVVMLGFAAGWAVLMFATGRHFD